MRVLRSCVVPVLAAALALATVSCSSWTGSQRIRFDDPYIDQLPAAQPGGWLGKARLFRAYARVNRAFELEKEGRLDAAATDLTSYLKGTPGDLRARAYLLSLLVKLDRTGRVVEEADRILDVEPAYVPALLARARVRAARGQLAPAVEDLLAASRSTMALPRDRTAALADAARYTLARADGLERADRWGAASAVYASALRLPLTPSQRVRARVGRDRSTAAQARADGDLEGAARQLEAALAVEAIPIVEQREILTRLAAALEAMKRPGKAGARVEQLLALGRGASGPSTSSLHRRAAALFLEAGQPVRAAGHLAAAGRLVRGAALLRRAAALYRRAGRYPAAIAALRDAVRMAPADPSVRADLGRTLMEAGRPAEAEAMLSEALAGASGGLTGRQRTESRLALASAQEAAGRIDDAMELYREVAAEEPARSPARLHALERLVALHGARGEHRRAGARMMELFRATGEGTWARRAADSYGVVRAWPDAAAAYRQARRAGALPGVEGARRLAVALYEAGEHEAAAKVLATIPPDWRTARDLRYMGAAAREAGQVDRAVALYRSAVGVATTREDSAAILGTIGYLLLQRSDSAAVAAMEASLRLRPDPALRLDVARAQMRLGRPDDALATLQRRAAGEATARPPATAADTTRTTRVLERLELLTQVQLARADTTAALKALEDAARLEPTAQRLDRLAYLYQQAGDERAAAGAFRRAYDAEPSAMGAARVAYADRRIGAEVEAAKWFRRAIDAAMAAPSDTVGLDLDALRQEEALLTDRFAFAAYASIRHDGGAAGLPPAGVGQVAVASQGGVEVRMLPLVQRVSWGREVDVVGRLFWAFDHGASIDPHSYQGQLGIRYRPRRLPGVALGLERWIGIGSAARDVWATRLQVSRLLGHPYPRAGAGPAAFTALYGDAAYLFDHAGTYTLYAEARSGVAVPLGAHTTLLPHVVASAYDQSPGGIGQSRIEAGPGLGLRLRLPREHAYTRDFWSLELLAQYRWGLFPTFWNAGGASYHGLVFTLVAQF